MKRFSFSPPGSKGGNVAAPSPPAVPSSARRRLGQGYRARRGGKQALRAAFPRPYGGGGDSGRAATPAAAAGCPGGDAGQQPPREQNGGGRRQRGPARGKAAARARGDERGQREGARGRVAGLCAARALTRPRRRCGDRPAGPCHPPPRRPACWAATCWPRRRSTSKEAAGGGGQALSPQPYPARCPNGVYS